MMHIFFQDSISFATDVDGNPAQKATKSRIQLDCRSGILPFPRVADPDLAQRGQAHSNLDFRFFFAYIVTNGEKREEASMYLTKRQQEILAYLKRHIKAFGYAPSFEEISRHFHLSSLATVHKHLSNLEKKGLIRREWNRSRSVEIVEEKEEGCEVPILGRVAAGRPIEAIEDVGTISIPSDMLGRDRTYILQVSGDSMIDDGIRDGDYVIVEDRHEARNGETVVALLDGENVTLKKYYREGQRIRLEPANPGMKPIIVDEEKVTIQGIVIGLLRKYRGA